MEERFGISQEIFSDYLLFERKQSWWLLRNSSFFPETGRIKVSLVGMRAFSRVGGFVKPSTRMIQVFGKHATKARWDMDEPAFRRLSSGNPLKLDLPLENGYVVISMNGHILGLGLLINGRLHSQIPRRELRQGRTA